MSVENTQAKLAAPQWLMLVKNAKLAVEKEIRFACFCILSR